MDKIKTTFEEIVPIRQIFEGVRAENFEATFLHVDFSQAFDSIPRGNMEQILHAYGLPKEIIQFCIRIDFFVYRQ